jgi:ABC-type polysaccharide/polyol phosphate transport system ATPase subunit
VKGLSLKWELVREFTLLDLKARYRGSTLGALWSLVHPLMLLGIYFFVFQVILRPHWHFGPDGDPFPYVLALFCGMIVFNVLGESLLRSPSLLRLHANYVNQAVFPVEILPVVVVGSALVQFFIGLGILMLAMLAFGETPTAHLLLLPAVLVPLLLLSLGLSWLVASLGVFSRDLAQAMPFLDPLLPEPDPLPGEHRPGAGTGPLQTQSAGRSHRGRASRPPLRSASGLGGLDPRAAGGGGALRRRLRILHAVPTGVRGRAMRRPTVIALDRVSKRYALNRGPRETLRRLLSRGNGAPLQEFTALDDISLEVRSGESLGIIGLNGAGKSSMLQLISGLRRPSSGTVQVHGRIASLIDLGSGFNPDFTGRENAFIYGAVLGMRREEIREKFSSIAAFADIGDFIDRPVKTYSSGMLLRLAFSVATQVEADILLFDEVLAVGDSAFQFKCFQRLQELRERGSTILMVSHDIETVTSLFPRAVILHLGRMFFDGESKTALWEYWRLTHSRNTPASGPMLHRGPRKLQSRVGTGEIRFLGADTLDVRALSRTTFEAGEGCVVRLGFIPENDVPRGSVGILVQNQRAIPVYGFNTAYSEPTTHCWKAGERQDLRIELTLNLVPGKYLISASCNRLDNGDLVLLGSLDSFAEIAIQGGAGAFGSSNLFAKVTYGRQGERADA